MCELGPGIHIGGLNLVGILIASLTGLIRLFIWKPSCIVILIGGVSSFCQVKDLGGIH